MQVTQRDVWLASCEGSAMRDADFETMSGIPMLDGVIAGIEQGWFQGEIADSAYALQQRIAAGRWVHVGVNGFTDGGATQPSTLYIDPVVEERQVKSLADVKA